MARHRFKDDQWAKIHETFPAKARTSRPQRDPRLDPLDSQDRCGSGRQTPNNRIRKADPQ